MDKAVPSGIAVRRLSEAVEKPQSVRFLCRTFGARRVWPFLLPTLRSGLLTAASSRLDWK